MLKYARNYLWIALVFVNTYSLQTVPTDNKYILCVSNNVFAFYYSPQRSRKESGKTYVLHCDINVYRDTFHFIAAILY